MEYAETLIHRLKEAYQTSVISETQLKEALDETYVAPMEQKIIVLKCQRKIVREDLEEEVPSYIKLEDVCASVIADKTISTISKQINKNFNQAAFRSAVIAYYNTESISAGFKDTEPNEAYCHLLGWSNIIINKEEHIVPKPLKIDGLIYNFGVGEVIFSDPRNGQ